MNLTTINIIFQFEDSVCLAYPEHKRHEYDDSLRRLLNTSFEYSKSRECFHDANLIQEKCTHLRDCCPNFDEYDFLSF